MNHNHPLPMSVDQLLAAARREAGIDRRDDDAIEALTILHRSIADSASLHVDGAAGMQGRIVRMLANRLRMQRDFAAHPEIAEQEIVAPLIVCGMPRSGTTKLQKTLAATGDFNWLPFWMAFNHASRSGTPGEAVDERIADTQTFCNWLDAANPGIAPGHAFEALEAEEETLLLDSSLRSTSLLAWLNIPEFAAWALPGQLKASLEYLRDSLKYLQWQGLARPRRPWVLKSIIYYGFEDITREVFPDARMVMPHRSPLETVPSSCKLIEQFRKSYTDAPFDGAANAAGFAAMTAQSMALRDAGKANYLDLSYHDLVRCEADAIEAIYDHYDIPRSADLRERIVAWAASHPIHRRGKFVYSLEEFGLRQDEIERLFSDYISRFQHVLRASGQ